MAASVTTGVMNPLLGKLTKLLGDEYKKLTGVRKQASFLRDELSAMKALLDKMELMDKLDPSAKNWKDHIREMTYDMENCIDDFMREIEGVDAKTGFVKKMAKRLRRLGRRHQIANRIEELKVLAVEANARRERCKIDDCVDSSHGVVAVDSSHGVVAVDPRVSAIYKEAAGLVGIDGPREDLVSLLMDSQEKLKVISIVGFGGLGISIGVLGHLKLLYVECKTESAESDSRQDSLQAPSLGLEVLDLEEWQFSRVPKWIGELRCLRILNLRVLQLSSDEVRVLGGLPSLVYAFFRVSDVSQDKVVVRTGLFPVLEHIGFKSDGDVSAYLSFEAGAMPKLQGLFLDFGWKEWSGATPVGMECLPCLQEIDVWLRDSGAHVRADVESAFKAAASVHPRHPSVNVSCWS